MLRRGVYIAEVTLQGMFRQRRSAACCVIDDIGGLGAAYCRLARGEAKGTKIIDIRPRTRSELIPHLTHGTKKVMTR